MAVHSLSLSLSLDVAKRKEFLRAHNTNAFISKPGPSRVPAGRASRYQAEANGGLRSETALVFGKI